MVVERRDGIPEVELPDLVEVRRSLASVTSVLSLFLEDICAKQTVVFLSALPNQISTLVFHMSKESQKWELS